MERTQQDALIAKFFGASQQETKELEEIFKTKTLKKGQSTHGLETYGNPKIPSYDPQPVTRQAEIRQGTQLQWLETYGEREKSNNRKEGMGGKKQKTMRHRKQKCQPTPTQAQKKLPTTQTLTTRYTKQE